MKIERLEELQQDINAQRSLSIQDCAALIGEVWRLRAALTAKGGAWIAKLLSRKSLEQLRRSHAKAGRNWQ